MIHFPHRNTIAAAFLAVVLSAAVAVAPAHAVKFQDAVDQAQKAGQITSGAAKAFKSMLRFTKSLGKTDVKNVQSGNGAITGEVTFLKLDWSFLAYSGGGANTTFVAFGPKKIFKFKDILKKVPGIALFDVIRFDDQMLAFAGADVEMESDAMPSNVKALTGRFFEGKTFTLEVPQGLSMFGNFNLGNAKVLNDAIKFLGGKSAQVYTRTALKGNVLDNLLEGSLPVPELELVAALPTFRPSIGGKITLPANVQFSLSGVLTKEDATLGILGNTDFKVGKQKVALELATEIKQPVSGPPEFSVKATTFKGTPWKKAFGVKWLTIEDYLMQFGQEADSVKVGFGGKTTIGGKQFDVFALAAVAAKTAGIPIPEELALAINDGPDKVGQLGLRDMASIFVEMAKATSGKNIKLPKQFPDVAIAGTAKGKGPSIAIKLKASGDAGIDISGALRILNSNVAEVDRAFIQADNGVEIQARTKELGIGPIKFPNADVDVSFSREQMTGGVPDPHVIIKTRGFSLFGSKSEMDLTLRLTQFELRALQDFGSLFKYKFLATTGEPIESLEHLADTDLMLYSSLSSDPREWIRTSGKKAVEAAFSQVSKDVDAARADLKKAQDDVAKLDGQIDSMKAKVEKEREKPEKQLQAAEAEVGKLNRQIDDLERKIKTKKAEIHSCNQNKSICVWGKPVRDGCKKKIAGHCVVPRYNWKCQQHKTVADIPARTVCQAKNVKPAAELAAFETSRGTLIASRTVAQKTLEGIRKGITSIPVELDPRVSSLIVARETAMGVLKAADGTVKGFGDFTKLLTQGVNAVGKPDIFALEESVVNGSLRGSLQGQPVVLTMNCRILGKAYQERLAFSMTDMNFNADQFTVIALGAATKTVIAAGRKAKVIPHKLLDKVNAIYAKKREAVNAVLEKAVADNNVLSNEKEVPTLVADINEAVAEVQEKLDAERKAEAEAAQKQKEKEAQEKIGQLAWSKLPGAAYDIGVGAGGHVWVIGTNQEGGGYGIYRWTGNTWNKVSGSAVRIAVDPKGNAWVVNKSKAIFRHDGKKWIEMPGAANDIGIGANGAVWVIGTNKEGGDYGIYRWNGKGWTKVKGGAQRIAVDPAGNPWVVNSNNNIYRYDGKTFVKLTGAAYDIGVGPKGNVWVVGTNKTGGGFGVWHYKGGNNWEQAPGGLVALSVAPDGKVWGVNATRNIYQMN